MAIVVKEAVTKKDYKQFVDFQFSLYADEPMWVPPIIKDEVKILQKEHNPAFAFCDAKFWLAYDGDKCMGRIGAIINNRYNEKMGEKIGRFSRLEFVDDKEVSSKLLKTAESWIKEKGMTTVQGPLGFTNLDNQGMLIEGFDHLPSALSVYHKKYYHEHIDSYGYEKEIDWLEFRIDVANFPEKPKRLSEILKKRNGFTVKSFTTSAELKPYGKELFKILNEAFKELFSVVQFDEDMVDYYVNRYIMLLNPHYVKFILSKDGDIIAFAAAVPSLSIALQKAKGKLFPFGWYHLKKALNKPTEVDMMLTGILPKYQGHGVAAIIMAELSKVFDENGVGIVETTGIFENNTKAIQNWKNFEHIQHKRRRCYTKAL